MAFKGINSDQFVFMILAAIAVVGIMGTIINFAAINNPDVALIKDISDETPRQMTLWIILFMAEWVVWSWFVGAGGRWDRKRIISFGLQLVVLYVAYNVIQSLMCSGGTTCLLPDLSFTAVQLEALVIP